MESTVDQHRAQVLDLSAKVKKFYDRDVKVRIFHGSTNSTRSQTFDPEKTLDTSSLDKILEIAESEDGPYALLEPNVPMDVLVRETLKRTLIPPVVMEFPGITVGGGIQGGAGESSSFKEGLFHECCLEYEMILGNGEIIKVSRHENPDLFWGTACSYGSLGVITLIKLRLIPASLYVRLHYIRTGSYRDAVDVLKREMRSSNDFVDGIIFSSDRGVVIVGERTDVARGNIQRFSRARDQWFYLHAEKIAKEHEEFEETVPLEEYLFRYDRGGFWMASYAFNRWSIPFNRLTRFIFNPFLKTRQLYEMLHATNTSQQCIVQDISLPENKTIAFLDFVREKIGIYPLWLCPLRPEKYARLSPAYLHANMIINVGVWGGTRPRHGHEALYALNREIEQQTEKLGGRKVLYAHTYYPKDEFWRIYDAEWYVALRKKFRASRIFSDIYEKVFVGGTYVPAVGSGLAKLFIRKIKQRLASISR
ncbi:FAD-binding oxidoreductase [Candidatus Kaiserbacteria bacterium]|nr:FAD-binding oxidoreductase [Candidatus Kaiserbacteria bacterium]